MGKFVELFKSVFKRSGTVCVNEINFEGKNITISSNGSRTKVTVDGVEVLNSTFSTVMNVVTKGDVEYLSTVSADVTVHGNTGRVSSTSGDINVTGNIKGDVSTVSGDVKSASITGNVKTVSGDIKR